MKNRYKISSVFLCILLMMTTTLQFHHHDCHGSVFFTVSADKDVVIGAFNHVSLAQCIHSDTSDNHHAPVSKDPGKCSLHIDQSDISRFLIGYLSWIATAINDGCLSFLITHSIGKCESYNIDAYYLFRHISLIIRSSSIFRAPPSI